jgi:hypothetical protein
MGTAQVTFEGVLPEVTWPEVTLVTWPIVTSVTCPVRKYVLRMRNRKLRHIRPSRVLWPEVTSVTWLEEALSGHFDQNVQGLELFFGDCSGFLYQIRLGQGERNVQCFGLVFCFWFTWHVEGSVCLCSLVSAFFNRTKTLYRWSRLAVSFCILLSDWFFFL